MSDWFYISFADDSGFLGGCYVEVLPEDIEVAKLFWLSSWLTDDTIRNPNETNEHDLMVMAAIRNTHKLKINPGGEAVVLGPTSGQKMDEAGVPESDRNRLLALEELGDTVSSKGLRT